MYRQADDQLETSRRGDRERNNAAESSANSSAAAFEWNSPLQTSPRTAAVAAAWTEASSTRSRGDWNAFTRQGAAAAVAAAAAEGPAVYRGDLGPRTEVPALGLSALQCSLASLTASVSASVGVHIDSSSAARSAAACAAGSAAAVFFFAAAAPFAAVVASALATASGATADALRFPSVLCFCCPIRRVLCHDSAITIVN